MEGGSEGTRGGSSANGTARRARRPVRAARSAILVNLVGAVTAMLVATSAAGTVTATPVQDVVAIPVVHAKTARISYRQHERVLVQSLEVSGLTARFMVTCDACLRRSGPIQRQTPAKGTVRFVGVNWLLVPGRDIRVATYRPRAVGRYELLTASSRAGNGLIFKASG